MLQLTIGFVIKFLLVPNNIYIYVRFLFNVVCNRARKQVERGERERARITLHFFRLGSNLELGFMRLGKRICKILLFNNNNNTNNDNSKYMDNSSNIAWKDQFNDL